LKIKTLKLTNFRNYENFTIDFNKNMNVIVAENGAGKTTVLDAIAIGYGAMLTRFPKIKGNTFEKSDLRIDFDNKAVPYMRIELESYTKAIKKNKDMTSPSLFAEDAEPNITWDRTQLRNQTKSTKKLIPKAKGLKELYNYVDNIVDKEYEKNIADYEIPLIMYYTTSRAVLKSPMRKTNFKKDFLRYEALDGSLHPNSDFKRLFQWFDAMQNRENSEGKEKRDYDYKLPELEAVRKSIEIMLHNMTNPRVETTPLRFVVDKLIDNKKVEFRINQLSDGYKTILAMVMDISGRMAEANPHLANKSEALIMIDEIDLHLHPRWQQTILIDLKKAFPKAQFIVTTHSPQILTTVQPQNIQALVLKEGQIKIEKFDFSWGAKSYELLNHILGVDERPQNLEIVKILNRYIELVDENLYDEEEALELREQLDSWGAGKEKELLRADMSIRAKEYRRKKHEKS
jgi:predicted ATP-binding protein involved in virulence